MSQLRTQERLIDRLGTVRGRLTESAPLAGVTWFRVGGPAEVMFRPADRDDLIDFLARKPADVRLTVIGVGSNLLVRDGGIPGVVIRLGREFSGIEIAGHEVLAGAGALAITVATAARDASLAGLEFLSGIPGTIGGGLRMNAGAYGREMKDVVIAAEAVDPAGRVHTLEPNELGFTYRHSAVPDDWIFLAARLAASPGLREEIARRMTEIGGARKDTQPIRSRTGGSTFVNPPGRKAWQLIDEAGCRGLVRGGAQVSEMHCNFLINIGSATAAEIEELGEAVRRRVLEKTGVLLEWEIRRVGMPGPAGRGAEAAP